MKTLEQGTKKIQQICDILKNDTIEPAKKEAEVIIDEAKARAHEIIKEAEKQALKLETDARNGIEQERNVFQSSLAQASKLTIESLKQEIQQKLFNQELHQLVEQNTADPKVITRLVEALIKAIDKDGLSANLSVVVPKTVSAKEINILLGDHIVKKLKEATVLLGDFTGGAKVKLHDKKLTLDISDNALMEMMAGFAPGFRKLIFAS